MTCEYSAIANSIYVLGQILDLTLSNCSKCWWLNRVAGRRILQIQADIANFRYELLQKCWLENPEDRPDFTEVYDELENILDTDHKDYATVVFVS